MTIAILDARDKEYVVVAAGADLIATYVQQAILAGQTAQEVLDAILAAGLAEGVFPSLAAGEAGTTDGQYFWVGDGGTVTLYLNNSGTGDEIAELATSASLADKVDTTVLASSAGSAMVGFEAAGSGAVLRSAEDKMRDSVSLEDYYSGDFADAIEEASAVAATVHVYGSAYEIDRIATVAASTDIVLHGTEISAASGNTATHMLTFSGSGSIRGTGSFVGGNLNGPSASWAGSGVPEGSAIYSAAANLGARAGHLIIDGAITFRDFPSGPLFTKWRDLVSVKGAIFDNCQTATVQWKASGSYVNIPATTNAGTSTSPIGEIITSHNVQAYQCAEARVEACDIDCYSKGISLNADRAYSLNNTFRYATSRHAMEHFTGCGKVVRSGNTYDGLDDHGLGSKIVYSTNVSGINNCYSSCSFGLYIQDCTGLTIGAENHVGTTASAYGFATTSSADGRAITDCVINLGTVRGVAGSKVIHIASDSAAVTAGYNFTIDLFGGRVSGFDGLIDHATPGIGEVIDLTWKGTEVVGATVAMDLRIRSCDVDLAFRNCTGPLINLGNVTGVSGTTAKVKMVATGCTGAFLLRYANGSAYQGIFQKTSIDISSSGGSPVRAISFSLGASDTLGLLNLDINCSDLTGSSGQAMAFDANSKAFKARVRLTISNALNVTFSNAGSMTGVLEKPIAGVITGGALTAV